MLIMAINLNYKFFNQLSIFLANTLETIYIYVCVCVCVAKTTPPTIFTEFPRPPKPHFWQLKKKPSKITSFPRKFLILISLHFWQNLTTGKKRKKKRKEKKRKAALERVSLGVT